VSAVRQKAARDSFGIPGRAERPGTETSIIDEGLPEDDPMAYAFLQALALTEAQLDDLENTINEVGDSIEGARQWAGANRDVVQPWIDAAENAQESTRIR
jgi:glycine betaine/proline transport system substrate-binding protein